jgi:predicted RND superfamily exporter protein
MDPRPGPELPAAVPAPRGFLRILPALLLALPPVLAYLTYTYVDLTPKVDQRFFFTPGSPIYEEHNDIVQRFSTQELLVVTAYTGDIERKDYLDRIRRLTARLKTLRPVLGVRSLTDGPDDVADARESPLWRRLLLLDNIQASNLILLVDSTEPRKLIDSVTPVLREMERPNFRLNLAGVPYVVDAIARNLEHDFRVFSLAAVGVFALVILALFRSFAILLGSITACATAALITLLVQQALVGRIGLLTANIVTIAFVLTQSHVVFMTNNWRQLHAIAVSAGPRQAVWRALSHTAGASVWCMVAALLGFGSLLFVQAQPLRELGFGGIIATLSALAAAYLVYPAFLLWAGPGRAVRRPLAGRARWLGPPPAWAAGSLLAIALAIGSGSLFLNSDPSLLDYFGRDSEIWRSLEAVDPHGGSSPLNIAVKHRNGGRLDNDAGYRKMWALQRALQNDPAVGTVLSLPVLMAEADRSLLSFLMSWEWLLDLLSRPEFDRAADSFVNRERTEALFLLRMVEGGRTERRTRIIARLENIIAQHGFSPTLVGGIYALQGRLADLVARSLVEGLAGLMLACAAIAMIITRSLPAGLAMAACSATIPAVTLGLAGFARVPLDIVVTPAVNVAVGVAVDSMIHLGSAWRRARTVLPGGAALRAAQREQAPGIVAFFIVVTAGFAIFTLSNFPPTQRFGAAVVTGTAVAAAMALWIFPSLLAKLPRRRSSAAAGANPARS